MQQPTSEGRSAQRYLEDLTPGGSEYFNNPKRCYEWAMGRIEATHRIALDAALERNRLQDNYARFRQDIRNLLHQHGVFSNPIVEDDWIVERLSELLERSAPSADEAGGGEV